MIDLGWNNSGRIGFYHYIAADMLYISPIASGWVPRDAETNK